MWQPNLSCVPVIMKECVQIGVKLMTAGVGAGTPATLCSTIFLPGAATRIQNSSPNFFMTVTEGTNAELINKLHLGEIWSPFLSLITRPELLCLSGVAPHI